jgi:hypothetical protein
MHGLRSVEDCMRCWGVKGASSTETSRASGYRGGAGSRVILVANTFCAALTVHVIASRAEVLVPKAR